MGIINNIKFNDYKNLIDLEIDLKSGINIIMGNNGTGKTSILHVVSNAYKSIPLTRDFNGDAKVIKRIKNINHSMNPKIEKLYRVSKSPVAVMGKGTLFSCQYNDKNIDFRKHQSTDDRRLRIAPTYSKLAKTTLPEGLVLYLGLSRLHSFGEYSDVSSITEEKGVDSSLPPNIMKKIDDAYYDLTGMTLKDPSIEKMGSVKNRVAFTTEDVNIDSNTISAGQDNVLILLTALYSIEYFLESSENTGLPGILLIDELENSLHPDFQIRFLKLLIEVASKYNRFQVICTTHSFEILNESIKKGIHLLYFMKSRTRTSLLDNPTEIAIRGLMTKNRKKVLKRDIPYFVEDLEANDQLIGLLEHFKEKDPNLSHFAGKLAYTEGKYGSESLINMFNKKKIPIETFSALGFLDGDQTHEFEIQNLLLVLPGKKCPEELLYDIMKLTSTNYSDPQITNFYEEIAEDLHVERDDIEKIMRDYEKIISCLEEVGKTTSIKGKKRSRLKAWYSKDAEVAKRFFLLWPKLIENQHEVTEFEKKLKIILGILGPIYSINPKYWSTT